MIKQLALTRPARVPGEQCPDGILPGLARFAVNDLDGHW
jgi:hypothetical protein